MTRCSVLLAVLAVLLTNTPARLLAQSATPMPIELRVMNAAGTPINTETAIRIRLYDHETGGDVVHDETFTVTPRDGYATVLLGSVTPLAPELLARSDLYLTVQIGDDAESTDRLRIYAIPLAGAAQVALSLPCPPGMTRIGASCIDDERQDPATYADALRSCADRGLELCSGEQYQLCDLLEPATSDCTVDTDEDATLMPPLSGTCASYATSWPGALWKSGGHYQLEGSCGGDPELIVRNGRFVPAVDVSGSPVGYAILGEFRVGGPFSESGFYCCTFAR